MDLAQVAAAPAAACFIVVAHLNPLLATGGRAAPVSLCKSSCSMWVCAHPLSQERKHEWAEEEQRRRAAQPDPNCPPGMRLLTDEER